VASALDFGCRSDFVPVLHRHADTRAPHRVALCHIATAEEGALQGTVDPETRGEKRLGTARRATSFIRVVAQCNPVSVGHSIERAPVDAE
jgi:hypothetical protein